ncbi:MAG: beta-ketoacyl-[acyl-carrier-protein] synthase family protein, partial [Methylocella sp.]
MADARRIVVTGMGAVSAAGIGAPALWQAARDGRSCVCEARFIRPHRGRIRIAAQVQDFDPASYLTAIELPFCDPVTQYLLVAADEAIAQAGLASEKPLGPRTATIIGTGVGGMHTLENTLYVTSVEQDRPDPLAIPRCIASAGPSQASIRYGSTGPCFAVASACSSATQAIGMGVHLIRSGLVDRVIAGGTEDCITNGAMLAWEALRVLTPDACRPFSKGRNGMVIGAGAAVFILEEAELARARGAEALAEIAGYGTSADANDPVRPDAMGAAACMRYALADACVEAGQIDYVNAHGTGTTANDATESEALRLVFGNRFSTLPVSSSKPIHGHALGAAGALELVVTIGAVRENVAPPTINWREADAKCPIDAV